jgi:ribose/xylose/arabinose/galactoside ABC-type transport system permease subunit
MGVPVDRLRVGLFMLSSTAAVFAGLTQSARFGSVDATRGTGLELQIIAAIVIGGTRITGGYGSIVGTALGCLTVAMIDNGMALLGLAGYWYQAVIGLLIVAAVVTNEGVGRVAKHWAGGRK